MVAMLLEHSAGPNMQAKNGLVPLHLAAQEDGVPAAEILKHFGVNMNQQTNVGSCLYVMLPWLLCTNYEIKLHYLLIIFKGYCNFYFDLGFGN